jgi:hypothetical protein
MKKEPNNPVYPMAMAIAQHQTSQTSKNVWLKKVIELAPSGLGLIMPAPFW